MRLNTLLHPLAYTPDENSNIFQKLIFLNFSSAITQNIIANFLIFGQALIINNIFISNRLSKEITLFAGLLYIIFISLIVENTILSPVLIANTFIILAVLNVFKTYKLPVATAFIFNTGLLLALASLFYSPYFTFIVFGIIALLILRSFKLLEKTQFFIGFVIPYFLLFTYRYWNGIPFVDLNFIKDIFFHWPDFNTDLKFLFYFSVFVLIAAVFISLLNYRNLTGKKSIQAQKKIDVVYFLMLFCLISFLIFISEGVFQLMTLAFPLSLLVGALISDSKNKLFNEILHIIVISLIFINQFKLIVL